jgi:hypothetical protein
MLLNKLNETVKKRRNIMRHFFVFIVALFLSSALSAQVHIHLNLDTQPIWGPTGYDYVENYYFPDIDAYYCVPTHLFYYFDRGHWISRGSLPARFHDFDLYSSYKVVVNDRNPWRNHSFYRDKYASFRGRHGQEYIRNSHDSRYFVNKNHPEHNRWMDEQRHGNVHDNGRMREDNRNKGNDRHNDVKGRDDKRNMNRDNRDNGRN